MTPVSVPRACAAFLKAHAVYWPAIRPRVHRHLYCWRAQAEGIPDPELRSCALQKLHDEQLNCEVAATLAALAPLRHRPAVIAAIVALQVMYDYLDGATEKPNPDRLRNSRQLFGAFVGALAPEPPLCDYYRHCAVRDDGGYLRCLADACSAGFWQLPAAASVAQAAIETAHRCSEAQSRTHAIAQIGPEQLQTWAAGDANPASLLTWWEHAAAGAASVLTVHALLAAAARPETTGRDAQTLADAYLPLCALSTLLDSIADTALDDDEHRFIAYYASAPQVAERLIAIAGLAAEAVSTLPDAGHHAMTVAGIATYYLSAPLTVDAQPIADKLLASVGPLAVPMLPVFRVWRRAQRLSGA